MRLLHGSNTEIIKPDLALCQSRNDFGRGFYLTPQWQRAYLMAKRRAGRDGGHPVVNPFLFYESKALDHGVNIKRFKGLAQSGQSSSSITAPTLTSVMTMISLLVLLQMRLLIKR